MIIFFVHPFHLISHKKQAFYKKRNVNSSDVALQFERDTLSLFKMEREMKKEKGTLKILGYICLLIILVFGICEAHETWKTVL